MEPFGQEEGEIPSAVPRSRQRRGDEEAAEAVDEGSHDEMSDGGTIRKAKPPLQRARFRQQFAKTRKCRFYARGHCWNAEKCAFAHGEVEVQIMPNLTKTSVCKQWVQGQCHFSSDNCRFAHGGWELRATTIFSKTTLCRSFFRGHCPMGDACRHAHSKTELQVGRSGMDSGSDSDFDDREDVAWPGRPSQQDTFSQASSMQQASRDLRQTGGRDYPAPRTVPARFSRDPLYPVAFPGPSLQPPPRLRGLQPGLQVPLAHTPQGGRWPELGQLGQRQGLPGHMSSRAPLQEDLGQLGQRQSLPGHMASRAPLQEDQLLSSLLGLVGQAAGQKQQSPQASGAPASHYLSGMGGLSQPGWSGNLAAKASYRSPQVQLRPPPQAPLQPAFNSQFEDYSEDELLREVAYKCRAVMNQLGVESMDQLLGGAQAPGQGTDDMISLLRRLLVSNSAAEDAPVFRETRQPPRQPPPRAVPHAAALRTMDDYAAALRTMDDFDFVDKSALQEAAPHEVLISAFGANLRTLDDFDFIGKSTLQELDPPLPPPLPAPRPLPHSANMRTLDDFDFMDAIEAMGIRRELYDIRDKFESMQAIPGPQRQQMQAAMRLAAEAAGAPSYHHQVAASSSEATPMHEAARAGNLAPAQTRLPHQQAMDRQNLVEALRQAHPSFAIPAAGTSIFYHDRMPPFSTEAAAGLFQQPSPEELPGVLPMQLGAAAMRDSRIARLATMTQENFPVYDGPTDSDRVWCT